MLDKLDDLATEVKKRLKEEPQYDSVSEETHPWIDVTDTSWVSEDKLFCPVCSKDRFVRIRLLKHTGVLSKICGLTPWLLDASINNHGTASLIAFICQQCSSKLVGLIFDHEDPKYVLLSLDLVTGRSLSKTPTRVLHFVDQAQKCQLAGAYGAAVAMYRVALEQILHDQGYTNGMLNQKIEELATKIDAGSAKGWELNWDSEMLHTLRKIGNLLIHPKNLNALIESDEELAYSSKAVIEFMLHEIYELPAENEQLLKTAKEMREKV